MFSLGGVDQGLIVDLLRGEPVHFGRGMQFLQGRHRRASGSKFDRAGTRSASHAALREGGRCRLLHQCIENGGGTDGYGGGDQAGHDERAHDISPVAPPSGRK
jgi:hypothetical protein